MKQDRLIDLYKKKMEDGFIRKYQANTYFNYTKNFYSDLQDGVASEENFFENTMAVFNQVDKPARKEDYVSDSGSRYWFYKKGIVRGSDHWGNGVANCDWPLKKIDGKMIYGTSHKSAKVFRNEQFGYCDWKDFVFKAQLHDIAGKEVLSTFNNVKGRDLIKVDKKLYQRKIVEVFEEV